MSDKHLLIPKIEDGIVIDHIPAGLGTAVLGILQDHAELRGTTTAVGLGLPSARLGRKDMIKLWSRDIPDHVVQHISLVAPGATVKRVRGFAVDKRYVVALPRELVDMVRCFNPNCITNVEPGAPTRFRCVDETARLFRCAYCEKVFPLAQLERIRAAPASEVPWSAE